MKKNKFDFRSEEERLEALNKIVAFFQDERGEEIGIIAAERIWKFFLDEFGEVIYKKALVDVKKIVEERVEDIKVELDLLADK